MPISVKCIASPVKSTRRSPPAAAPSRSSAHYAGRAQQRRRRAVRARQIRRGDGRIMTARLRSKPDFVQAHSNRGNALQRLKRFAEAEHAYRRAIGLQPAFADAWNNLGTCLRELKRPDEAEAAYRKALELQSEQSRHAGQSRACGQRSRPPRRSRRSDAARARRSNCAATSFMHTTA